MIVASRAVERLSGSQRDLSGQLPKPRTAKMIGLHRGDPSFDTPAYVVEAAYRALKDGYTHYPPLRGDPALREAVAAYQSRNSGVPISPSEVMITAAAAGAVYAAIMATVSEGDEVIVLDPTFSSYADVVRLVGGHVVPVPVPDTAAVDVDAVRAAVTPRTRMLVLNFPSNPTGQLLGQRELDGLAAIAEEHDLIVLSDEVYDQLVFKGKHISPYGHPALTNRTILVHSFSKTYAMTGWRVGYLVAKPQFIEPIWTIIWTTVAHANHAAQRAALEALTNEAEDRKWRSWMLAEYEERRRTMWRLLGDVPGVHVSEPEAAFYAWVRYDAPLSAIEMVKYLHERGLDVRPGTEFGATRDRYIRFTFAPSIEVITEGMAIFKAAMQELQSH
jgi:aspartate aminotransferase